jgi:hypothetical protein
MVFRDPGFWFFSCFKPVGVFQFRGMPRRLRIGCAGAIYHVMAPGNGRQDIVRDDADRDGLQQEELGRADWRCARSVYAFVMKPGLTRMARGARGF